MASVSDETIAEVYRKCAITPTISKASLKMCAGLVHVDVHWNQHDLENFETIKSLNSFLIDNGSGKTVAKTSAIDISTESMNSKFEEFRAVLRKVTPKKGDEKQMLEIWKDSCKIVNIDISVQEHHGKIYDDVQFGCFEWSHDGTHLLYVAEKKRAKTESFFKIISSSSDEKTGQKETSVVKGDEFLFIEDWGERFMGKSHPIICSLEVKTKTITVLPMLPDEISFGQAIWTHDDSGIVCVGWWHHPRRLGIAVCSNRRSALFHFQLGQSDYTTIGQTNKSVHSPRFSPDGKKLVYLENEVGGAHHKGSRLIKCSWPDKITEMVVDLVNEDIGNEFPGLYLFSFPKRIWLDDNKTIVFHSCWRSREEIIAVDTDSKEITKLTEDKEIGSWNVLDICNNTVVVGCSAPNMKEHLRITNLTNNFKKELIQWKTIENEDTLVPGIEWKILTLQPPPELVNPKYPELQLEIILTKPAGETKTQNIPLIVCPHGGPHCAHAANYQFSKTAFMFLGFATAFINYRGSAGFGENNLNSLPGNIGSQDVADCKFALNYLMEHEGFDRNKLIGYGGSHGGFLITHMIGQHPDLFKACVARNAVTNLSSKFDISDIPDWGWFEAGFEYTPVSQPSPEVLKAMWEKSPMRYVDEVKTPLLILMGKNDVRVPPSQNLLYYHALQARNVPVRMNVYDDCHGLSKPEVAADSFVHTVLWFLKYLES